MKWLRRLRDWLAALTWPDWLYTLRDGRDRWLTPDKEAHFFGASAVFGNARAFGAPEWLAAALVLVLVILVEAIESRRWLALNPERRANIELGRARWPWLTDRASLKDVLVGLLGLVVTGQLWRWFT